VRRCGFSVSGGKSDDCPGRWCWRSARSSRAVGCRGGGSETLAVLRALTSCRAEDGIDRATPKRVDFFIFVRASHVCFSHSNHAIFSPIVRMDWCFELEHRCSWILGGLGSVALPLGVVLWFHQIFR
jgi:hypothetical protein